MKLERITKFRPAYDKRSSVPGKDYGIHCVQCYMVLKGSKGAVHFTFSTGMFLESTMLEYVKNGRAKYEMISPTCYFSINKPMGFDVGYHSPKPMFKGQELVHPRKTIFPKDFSKRLKEKKEGGKEALKAMASVKFKKIGKKPPICEFIGVPCYCDGSAIRAEEFMKVLTERGSDVVWKMLEDDYKAIFKK